MKKFVSLILAALMLSSSTFPVLAQKGRVLAGGKVAPLSRKAPAALQESTRFANSAAYTDGGGVLTSWQMDAEIGNIGFYVYRVGKHGTELLNEAKMVRGNAMQARAIPSYGESYSFYDPEGSAEYGYVVEAIGLDGGRLRTAMLYPQYVPSIESKSGMSSSELYARATDLSAGHLEDAILTLTKDIVSEMEEAQQLADPVTHKTVISQPGARIGVRGEGIVRVSKAQLQAAGFNVNSDPALWQLYFEGVEQAILIGDNADYIEFYGKGTDTPETDVNKYYLIVGAGAGKRIESRVATRNTSTVVAPGYFQTFTLKERTQYVEDILNGDLENYWGRTILSSSTATVTFNLTGVDFSHATTTLNLNFHGFSATQHLVEVSINNNALTAAPGGSGKVPFSATYSIPTSLLLEGQNTLKFKTSVSPDSVLFDSVSISFARKYEARSNKLAFYTHNYRAAKLDGFTSPNVRVFDTTREGAPVLMTNLNFVQNGATFGVNMPAGRGRQFYAVEDSAILAPESVTPNNPELLGIPTNEADLVIISYKDFLPDAELWATYRRNQGFAVKVIEVSDIYDEFNYGRISSSSLQSFLHYAYVNWLNKPEYALLLGDASFDPRNYENLGMHNLVPPKMVVTVNMETASDEALADFDNDGLAEIAVGRVAARVGTTTVATVYNKTVNWESNLTNPLARGAVFAYDFNDPTYRFDEMSQRIRAKLPPPPTMEATMIFRGQPDANTAIVNQLNQGKYVVNYAGHGTAGSWGGNPIFFASSVVPSLGEHNPSVYTMLTCLNGYYQWLYNPSLAEVLVNSPNKGAVVAWASTGKTTPDLQEVMAHKFYERMGDGTVPRVGDLVKEAKAALDRGTDVRFTWALFGDPMLKVR